MRPRDVHASAYGFAWGNVLVERLASDERIGWIIRIWARHEDGHLGKHVDIRVTPNGTRIEAVS